MRRTCLRRLVRLLMVAPLVACLTCGLAVAAEDPPDGPLVLALYHGRYDWSTWSEPTCDEPLHLYVSADASAVDRHVREAKSAGIDGLVQMWYGPRLADNPTAPNLELLLDSADRHEMRVAVLLDMTGPFMRTPDDVVAALAAVREELAPNRAYMAVEGRPVIFFLGQQLFPLSVWESLRAGTDASRAMIWIAEGTSVDSLSVFDGLYLHQPELRDPAGSRLPALGEAVRGWNQTHQTSRWWVATVMPGYDDSFYEDDALAWVRPREAGLTYRQSWSTARASEPDWLLIRSFNGWSTCTQIEPSAREGDIYLRLTEELIAQLRAPVEVTPTPTETPEPFTPTPTEPTEPLTVTATLTVTPEVTVTMSLTPTETLPPTATPFRLATPTPMVAVAQPDGAAVSQPTTATPASAGGAAPQRVATATPVLRLPVEGAAPSRCLALPMMMVLGVVGGTRLRKRP